MLCRYDSPKTLVLGATAGSLSRFPRPTPSSHGYVDAVREKERKRTAEKQNIASAVASEKTHGLFNAMQDTLAD